MKWNGNELKLDVAFRNMMLGSLSKPIFCQHGRQIAKAGLKTVFVSVRWNLQHIWQNIRILKFFAFLHERYGAKLQIVIFLWFCMYNVIFVLWCSGGNHRLYIWLLSNQLKKQLYQFSHDVCVDKIVTNQKWEIWGL
jgi:hypothetical protein